MTAFSTEHLLTRLRVYADDVIECNEELEDFADWPTARVENLEVFKRRARARSEVRRLSRLLVERKVEVTRVRAAGGVVPKRRRRKRADAETAAA